MSACIGRVAFAALVAPLLFAAAARGIDAREPTEPWRFALTSNREGDSEIYSMKANGTGVRRLTRTPGFDGAGPFSPDGRKLLYYRNQGGVWVMNADGSGKRNLTPNDGFNAPGSWSPDGSQILFTSNRDGNHELYVMNADGSGQRILATNPSSQEWAGGWSPDGRTIFFSTDRDGNWEIYAMDADGSNARNLTRSPRNDAGLPGLASMSLSPDGRRIVFASTRDTRDQDNPELYAMNANGSAVRRLTRWPGVEGVGASSPDGRKLVVWHYPVKPRWAFFVMNADGSGVRKVTWSLPGKS
jgi:Tol biopolymer transport system component